MSTIKILIIGAGIVGLATARELSAKDIDYKLIEKKQWSSDGAGICLPANAVSGFESLGLKAELLSSVHQVKNI